MNVKATNSRAWTNALAINMVCLWVAGCDVYPSDNLSSRTPVYSIEGNQVQLEGGSFDSEDGTVSLLTLITGDLDGDADGDQAAILLLDSRGSGVFYYLNVLLNDGNGTLGQVEEEFIGDRIKFDFIKIYEAESVSPLTASPILPYDQGQVVVGYYIHGPKQAYAEPPGLYITRHWKIENSKLVMVED